ncbi:UDP-3-O-(3-hydroxymyristoyl)glucosamine N-acyltransferase [Pseudoroseicyclus aestuarii]|uniref:UDP-3-O-acylglucosamine N-acyltransferase n=1 Tax=Pseudoroseicyclus aestuarii TaxID=1795041 RepID=A0A318SX34_9RHOB|nr:UDP-3-O-(3-hydroxymyristoyl)glucosamine N-acyltransferase [Pseudoroseicyclus aestuarii]PYE86033.1 UDP-3-O-[3-hydroxymyristoyl] glucosamine N-acyltransferase [Pseudoroseicyclus aestuarii]
MPHTIAQIADALGVEALGDASLTVTGAAEPAAAGPGQLALALSPQWAQALGQGGARAAMLWPGADWQALGLEAAVIAPRGRLAMGRVTAMFDPGPEIAPGIHPQAHVEEGAELGEDLAIGPFTSIGKGARIGAGTRIAPGVTIGAGAEIGPGALIHAGVRIGRGVRIGARAIIQPNAVIGGDGFSFVTEEPAKLEAARAQLGQVEGAGKGDPTWHRIHSLGSVVLGDDVEIGANTTIDSGTIRPTRIGNGTKIDNLVQVGHNCLIGEHCLLCGHVGLAGSVTIGDRAVLAGKVGVADNLTIGADVVVTGASSVLSNVPAGWVMMGYPATKIEIQIESYKALRRLPRLMRSLTGSQKPVPKPGQGK